MFTSVSKKKEIHQDPASPINVWVPVLIRFPKTSVWVVSILYYLIKILGMLGLPRYHL